MTRIILILLAAIAILVLLLMSNGDQDAIDRAKADRIYQETQQRAQAQTAAEARTQADWEATRDATYWAKRIFGLLVACSVAVALTFALTILIYRAWQVSGSIAVYAQQRAALQAGMIRLDRQTGTWPALIAGGAIHNLQTGEVYLLTVPKAADPQQVSGDVLIRALGVGTRGAAQIGKATQDGAAANAIPVLAGSLPLVLRPNDSESLNGR
jgi:hypothetical protein